MTSPRPKNSINSRKDLGEGAFYELGSEPLSAAFVRKASMMLLVFGVFCVFAPKNQTKHNK